MFLVFHDVGHVAGVHAALHVIDAVEHAQAVHDVQHGARKVRGELICLLLNVCVPDLIGIQEPLFGLILTATTSLAIVLMELYAPLATCRAFSHFS